MTSSRVETQGRYDTLLVQGFSASADEPGYVAFVLTVPGFMPVEFQVSPEVGATLAEIISQESKAAQVAAKKGD